jgi:arylsulfatase A-like enzyme
MRQKPNIIVLILDTLRSKNMSAYGYPKPTTPNLDLFASESVLFRNAISAATWTVPSHASLLSGLYVSQHRIETIDGDRRFNEKIIALPEALRSQDYHSAAFSQNMLFSSDNNLDEGFDEFLNVDELLDSQFHTKLLKSIANDSIRPLRLTARYVRKLIAPRLVLDNLLEWIKARDPRSPFFLMANVLAPHFPWTLPPRFFPRDKEFSFRYLLRSEYLTLKKQWEYNSGKRNVSDEHRRAWHLLYDAAIRHVDSEIGKFIEQLRRWKGWENTILVITSDHGEMMGEYRDIVGHVLCLHDNLIHVPLIVRHPDHPGGLNIDGVVQTLDLFSSIVEWSGVSAEVVHPAQLQRRPLSKAIENPEDASGMAFAEEDYTDSYDVIGKLLAVNPDMDPHKFPRRQVAVRSATHKLIHYDDRPEEFFNISRDPDEQKNIIKSDDLADRVSLSELWAALMEWQSGLQTFVPRRVDRTTGIDLAAVERLRALGYVP